MEKLIVQVAKQDERRSQKVKVQIQVNGMLAEDKKPLVYLYICEVPFTLVPKIGETITIAEPFKKAVYPQCMDNLSLSVTDRSNVFDGDDSHISIRGNVSWKDYTVVLAKGIDGDVETCKACRAFEECEHKRTS